MGKSISVSELMRAQSLEAAEKPPEGFRTMRQWWEEERASGKTACGFGHFSKQVRTLVDAGLVEERTYVASSGKVTRSTPHYRVKEDES